MLDLKKVREELWEDLIKKCVVVFQEAEVLYKECGSKEEVRKFEEELKEKYKLNDREYATMLYVWYMEFMVW